MHNVVIENGVNLSSSHCYITPAHSYMYHYISTNTVFTKAVYLKSNQK